MYVCMAFITRFIGFSCFYGKKTCFVLYLHVTSQCRGWINSQGIIKVLFSL